MRGNLYCHPFHARPLWPNEFLALQGIKNTGNGGFAMAGSTEAKYRQAGNGIPPQLTEKILSSLLEALE
jgi:site-specific DNA-cytosine methylase